MSSNGRLQGRLEVSRAFGDRQFKKVSIDPFYFLLEILNVLLSKRKKGIKCTLNWYLKEVHKLQVGVVATPDIHSFDVTDKEHFIILGCDGLWGVCLLLVSTSPAM